MFNRKFIKTLSNTLLCSLLVSSLSMIPVQHTSAKKGTGQTVKHKSLVTAGYTTSKSSTDWERQSAADEKLGWKIEKIHEVHVVESTTSYQSAKSWQVEGAENTVGRAKSGGYIISFTTGDNNYYGEQNTLYAESYKGKIIEPFKVAREPISIYGRPANSKMVADGTYKNSDYTIAPIYVLADSSNMSKQTSKELKKLKKKDIELITAMYSDKTLGIKTYGYKEYYSKYVLTKDDFGKVFNKLNSEYYSKLTSLRDNKGKVKVRDMKARLKKFIFGSGDKTVAKRGTKSTAMNTADLKMSPRYKYDAKTDKMVKQELSQAQEDYNASVVLCLVALSKFKYDNEYKNSKGETVTKKKEQRISSLLKTSNTDTSDKKYGIVGQLNKYMNYLMYGADTVHKDGEKTAEDVAVSIEPLVEISCSEGIKGGNTYSMKAGEESGKEKTKYSYSNKKAAKKLGILKNKQNFFGVYTGNPDRIKDLNGAIAEELTLDNTQIFTGVAGIANNGNEDYKKASFKIKGKLGTTLSAYTNITTKYVDDVILYDGSNKKFDYSKLTAAVSSLMVTKGKYGKNEILNKAYTVLAEEKNKKEKNKKVTKKYSSAKSEKASESIGTLRKNSGIRKNSGKGNAKTVGIIYSDNVNDKKITYDKPGTVSGDLKSMLIKKDSNPWGKTVTKINRVDLSALGIRVGKTDSKVSLSKAAFESTICTLGLVAGLAGTAYDFFENKTNVMNTKYYLVTPTMYTLLVNSKTAELTKDLDKKMAKGGLLYFEKILDKKDLSNKKISPSTIVEVKGKGNARQVNLKNFLYTYSKVKNIKDKCNDAAEKDNTYGGLALGYKGANLASDNMTTFFFGSSKKNSANAFVGRMKDSSNNNKNKFGFNTIYCDREKEVDTSSKLKLVNTTSIIDFINADTDTANETYTYGIEGDHSEILSGGLGVDATYFAENLINLMNEIQKAISSNRGNNNTEQDQVEYYKKAFEEGFNSWYKSYFASYLNTTEHLEELEEMMAEYAMKSAIAFDMSDEPVSRLADF